MKSNIETNKIEIVCRYITRKGKRIYPKNKKYFHFWVEPKTAKTKKKEA